MEIVTQLNLVSESRMSADIPLLLLHAFISSSHNFATSFFTLVIT